jgi:hypothetical protein
MNHSASEEIECNTTTTCPGSTGDGYNSIREISQRLEAKRATSMRMLLDEVAQLRAVLAERSRSPLLNCGLSGFPAAPALCAAGTASAHHADVGCVKYHHQWRATTNDEIARPTVRRPLCERESLHAGTATRTTDALQLSPPLQHTTTPPLSPTQPQPPPLIYWSINYPMQRNAVGNTYTAAPTV